VNRHQPEEKSAKEPSAERTLPAPCAKQRPTEEILSGRCSVCGADAVMEMSYLKGRGYLMRTRCCSSFGNEPSCDWTRVM
jgi:hypothetical protein